MSETEMVENGPLIRVRLSVSRAVFRLGPAWSVIAGALVVSAFRLDPAALLRVLTAAVLADLVWGAIRQVTPFGPVTGSASEPRPPAPAVSFLPYARPGAPLARWLATLTPAQAPGVWQEATEGWQGVLVGMALALLLSVLLGWPAVILTVCVLATLWLAASLARRGDVPALAHALLDVWWPWLLGMSLPVGQIAGGQWAVPQAPAIWPGLLLALAFSVLQWGAYRWAAARGSSSPVGLVLAWCGQFGLLISLIVLRAPWAVGCVAALLVVPSFWLSRARRDAGAGMWYGYGPLPWWWAASLVAAFAVR